jgi:hypothetical protein
MREPICIRDNAPTTSTTCCASTNFPAFANCYSPISAFTPRILTFRGFSSTTGSTRSQPSPVRTTAPHGYPSLACGTPNFMPRFVRSVMDLVTLVYEDHSVKNITRAFPSDDASWASSDSAFPRRSLVPPLPNRRRHYHTPIQKRIAV